MFFGQINGFFIFFCFSIIIKYRSLIRFSNRLFYSALYYTFGITAKWLCVIKYQIMRSLFYHVYQFLYFIKIQTFLIFTLASQDA